MSKSKSARISNRNAIKSTTHAPAAAAGRNVNDRAPGRPRINFGPARAAAHDLVVWVLGLAAREVANWPEGRRRVRSTRRYILAQLRGERPQRGERPRRVPVEDALFTATILARLFEAELGLPMTELVAILDRIGVLGDDAQLIVPSSPAVWQGQGQAPRRAANGASMPAAPIAPVAPLTALLTALRPRCAPVQPTPVSACEQCGQVGLRFRVAA